MGNFAALRTSFKYFTMFFRDSEVCMERFDSYGDFGYLKKKSNISILREICKRTHCPSIVIVAFLLFLGYLIVNRDKKLYI